MLILMFFGFHNDQSDAPAPALPSRFLGERADERVRVVVQPIEHARGGGDQCSQFCGRESNGGSSGSRRYQ